MATDRSIIRPEANFKIIESHGSSKTEFVKCKYTWTIHNFSKRLEGNGYPITSPTFPIGQYKNLLQWELLVYPKGYDTESENYISLFVESCGDLCDGQNNIATLKMLNFPSKEMLIRDENSEQYDITSLGCKQFIERNILLDALVDDQLVIFCEILTERDVTYGDDSIPSHSDIGDDLECLFEYQDFSDLTFSVGERQLKAHKAIMVARSPVFKDIFAHENKENWNNIFKIADVKYEVFKEMLRFMYCEKVQNLRAIAMDLLVAADKYQLNELKSICEKASLSITVSVKNAVETFIFADKYHASSLKNFVLNFIRKHSNEVVATTGWKLMMKDYPHLVEEAFCAMAKNCLIIYD